MSTDQIVRGIAAGKVPDEALVCDVGVHQWRLLRDVSEFRAALQARADAGFNWSAEHTLVDFAPLPSEATAPPSPVSGLHRFDENAERTIVDAEPLRPSEPPPASSIEPATDGAAAIMLDRPVRRG